MHSKSILEQAYEQKLVKKFLKEAKFDCREKSKSLTILNSCLYIFKERERERESFCSDAYMGDFDCHM